MARCSEKTASSAVKGVPSWNCTPWRSVRRSWFGLTWVQAVASLGSMRKVRLL